MEAIPGDRPPPPRTGRGPTELEDTGEVGAEAAHMAEAGVEGAGTVGGMGDTEGNGRLAPVLQRASGPLSQGSLIFTSRPIWRDVLRIVRNTGAAEPGHRSAALKWFSWFQKGLRTNETRGAVGGNQPRLRVGLGGDRKAGFL